MIYYKANLRGVLDWARGDVYFQGEVPSAEEIELFDERFTTQANQGFTNPQLSKQVKETGENSSLLLRPAGLLSRSSTCQ